jgi:hypothetical protein
MGRKTYITSEHLQVLRHYRFSCYSFKAALLLYVPPGLKFQNSASCPHSGFICFCMDMRTNSLTTTAAAAAAAAAATTTTTTTTTTAAAAATTTTATITTTTITTTNTNTISLAATSNNIYYCYYT